MNPYIPDELPVVGLNYEQLFGLVSGVYFTFHAPQQSLWSLGTSQDLFENIAMKMVLSAKLY